MRDKATKAAKEQDVKAKTADETTTLHVNTDDLKIFVRQVAGFVKPFIPDAAKAKKKGYSPMAQQAATGLKSPINDWRGTNPGYPEHFFGYYLEYTFKDWPCRFYCMMPVIGAPSVDAGTRFNALALVAEYNEAKGKKSAYTCGAVTIEVVQ